MTDEPEDDASRLLEIQVLGTFQITSGSEVVLERAPVRAGILHALALADGTISRTALEQLLGERAFNQLFYELAGSYPKQFRRDATHAYLERSSEHLRVDLWEFLSLVENGERTAGFELLDNRSPAMRDEAWREHPAFASTLERFRRARDDIREHGIRSGVPSGRTIEKLRSAREHALARSIVSEIPAAKRLGDVREVLTDERVPWRDELADAEGTDRQRLQEVIKAALLARGSGGAKRIFLCGGPGSGKSLVGTLVFLALVDSFDAELERSGKTTFVPVRFDVRDEWRDPDFGTDEWLADVMRELGIAPPLRPIFIFEHIDAMFPANAPELDGVLARRIFRDHDALFCCQRQFYVRHLATKHVATDVLSLTPWQRPLQVRYTAKVFGKPAADRLKDWLDSDRRRVDVTAVPLHLMMVTASLLAGDRLAGISTAQQLFKRVSRLRLAREGASEDEVDDRLRLLGRIAHAHYQDARATLGEPIVFSSAALTSFLRSELGVGASAARSRVRILSEHTVLEAARDGSLRFEHPRWGWYFVAVHIANVVRDEPQAIVTAFRKFLSSDVTEFLVDMLLDVVDQHPDRVQEALREALMSSNAGAEADLARVRIARQQVAYFLGTLGVSAIRNELAPYLDDSSPAFEADHWVRRAIVFGLADGGQDEFVDAYVEALRAEVAGPAPWPQRDTNIGFYLTFRGDQPLDVEAPDRISASPGCGHTVAELVRGLRQKAHKGSWRIKLFTLVDLGRHPAIPGDAFEAAVSARRRALEQVVTDFRADPRRRHWPEIDELDDILRRLGS